MSDANHSATPLNERPPLSELTGLPERLEFLGISESDRSRLRDLAQTLKSSGPAFVEAFYRHLFAFEQTAKFLQDPALVARLKEAQLRHLDSMLEAEWDEQYVARRYRVGDVHAQVGVNPQMFLGAYNHYLHSCLRELSGELNAAGRELIEQMLSLQKAVFLDIGLTMEAYFTQVHARTQAGSRPRLSREYGASSVCAAHFARLEDPLGHDGQPLRRSTGRIRRPDTGEAARLIKAARDRAFRMGKTIDELLSSTISLHTEIRARPSRQPASLAGGHRTGQARAGPEKDRTERGRARCRRYSATRLGCGKCSTTCCPMQSSLATRPPGESTSAATTNDHECVFAITDNGPGIPGEELSRVFVPFRRLPAHRNTPGSGLGPVLRQNDRRAAARPHLGGIGVGPEAAPFTSL